MSDSSSPSIAARHRAHGWSSIVAWGLLATGVLLEVAAFPMAFAVNRVVEGYVGVVGFVLALVGLVWLATGALIVSRQPGNWAGWLFCFIGLAVSFSSFIQAYAVYGLRVSPGSLPLIGLAAWLNEYAYLAIAFLPLLFLLFPDGHLPGRAWRWAVAGLLGGMGLAFLAFLVRAETFNNLRDFGIEYENPFGIESLGQTPGNAIAAGALIAIASSIACVFGLRARFKRSTGEERQQMRWLVFVGTLAAASIAVLVVFGFVAGVAGLGEEGDALPIFPILLGLTALTISFGVPAAFLVAILRYRLYQLDIVIRKTVIVGSMAVFIAVVYGAIVGGLGALAGSRGGPTFSFLAATVLAIAFQPARERARRLADRVV